MSAGMGAGATPDVPMAAGDWRFCPRCAAALAPIERLEDGGPTTRLRCAAGCGFTHWNNPTPVLAAICEGPDGRVLLARNAAWKARMFALVTGFLEAGESPEDGIRREIAEETGLDVRSVELVGVHPFARMNQVIVTYHARCAGEVRLSPELAEAKWFEPGAIRCWRAGTGLALADWLRRRGIEPTFLDPPGAA